MPRLIDADAFLAREIKRCHCVPLVGSGDRDYESLKLLLQQEPAIDPVRVVRCKDCGNFRQNAYGVCWCDEYGGTITPEDYCSRAVTDKPSRVKIPWEAD